MSWSDELTKIRRLLRDPDSNIWGVEFLRHLYNDTQKDFQHKTSVLENIATQRVPGLYHFSYMHDWEYAELPSKYSVFYQCLSQHDESVFCHRWEPQETTGIDADVSDYGAHFTQPWEAFMLAPGEVVRMQFPGNLRSLKYIAYDEQPITATTQKKVQSNDASYITNTGTPIAYYEVQDVEDSFVLYPRPSTSFVNEIDGNEGPAWYVDGDSEDITTGTIAVRVGSTGTDLEGISFDITDTTDNVFLIYDVEPEDVVNADDEGDYPEYLRKYIRYGVLARAYGANTDGRIGSLSDYWALRYRYGERVTKRYRRNRKQDRDYRLTTKARNLTRRRLPRLPDTYPEVNR